MNRIRAIILEHRRIIVTMSVDRKRIIYAWNVIGESRVNEVGGRGYRYKVYMWARKLIDGLVRPGDLNGYDSWTSTSRLATEAAWLIETGANDIGIAMSRVNISLFSLPSLKINNWSNSCFSFSPNRSLSKFNKFSKRWFFDEKPWSRKQRAGKSTERAINGEKLITYWLKFTTNRINWMKK